MKEIFMEPEEYEAYLKEQEEQKAKLQEYYDSLKEGGQTNIGTTLYELNQQIMSQMPALDADGVRKCSGKILKYLDEHIDSYYMLLCKELSYYTIFHITSAKPTPNGNIIVSRGALRDLTTEIVDVISTLGDVRVIEPDNNGAIAVWSSFQSEETDTIHCFYLFPYGGGVVEV